MITITHNEADEITEKAIEKFTGLVWERRELDTIGASTVKIQPKVEQAYLNLRAMSKYIQDRFEIGEYNNYITQRQVTSILSRTNEL